MWRLDETEERAGAHTAGAMPSVVTNQLETELLWWDFKHCSIKDRVLILASNKIDYMPKDKDIIT